jgi:CRISPR/Cas system-associated endonuclease Cas1
MYDSKVLRVRLDSIKASGLDSLRGRLLQLEGTASKRYFKQIFELLPDRLRSEKRKTFRAYDGTNNIFNVAYEVLSWKFHRAIIRA